MRRDDAVCQLSAMLGSLCARAHRLLLSLLHSTQCTHPRPHYCRAQFEREKAFVADQNALYSDLVQLSIGGQMFATVPRTTLVSGDSMLFVGCCGAPVLLNSLSLSIARVHGDNL